jgi:hypothetical protein
MCILLEKAYKKTSLNNFISGFVCGYIVWRHKTPVNYQIVLYLFSRVAMALVEMAWEKWCRWKEEKELKEKGENL